LPGRIGEVALSTGQFVVCDPMMAPRHARALTRALPVGRYPLDLIVVVDPHSPAVSVAYALLVLSSTQPTSWELALTAEQSLDTLDEDCYFGFGVDTGVGCYTDAARLPVLAAAGERLEQRGLHVPSTSGYLSIDLDTTRFRSSRRGSAMASTRASSASTRTAYRRV
jgi:Protein of unknown function (DUF4241)